MTFKKVRLANGIGVGKLRSYQPTNNSVYVNMSLVRAVVPIGDSPMCFRLIFDADHFYEVWIEDSSILERTTI